MWETTQIDVHVKSNCWEMTELHRRPYANMTCVDKHHSAQQLWRQLNDTTDTPPSARQSEHNILWPRSLADQRSWSHYMKSIQISLYWCKHFSLIVQFNLELKVSEPTLWIPNLYLWLHNLLQLGVRGDRQEAIYRVVMRFGRSAAVTSFRPKIAEISFVVYFMGDCSSFGCIGVCTVRKSMCCCSYCCEMIHFGFTIYLLYSNPIISLQQSTNYYSYYTSFNSIFANLLHCV